MKYICSAAIMLALVACPAFAQFYQYTDRNGNTVITDSPPPGVEAQEKKFDEERVYRSTGPAQDYPADESKEGPHRQEQPKKNYNRLTVAMYMTDW